MQTYTPEQVAEILQISPLTVRELARSGTLRGSKIARRWRFTEADLQLFLEQQQNTRQPETTP